MSKQIFRIVLTGGPAAGKTTLVSRILKEFKPEDGWRVLIIPESATDLISGFGIKPFGGCLSMLAFQDFVISDQLHKERLALQAAQLVPEERVLILYDRAVLDDKAYITDDEFTQVLSKFDGITEQDLLDKYDAVIHLVTCAKGAEFAYNLGNNARTESIEEARRMDDRTLRAWSSHPNLRIIDNSIDFEDKMRRAVHEILRITGETEPMERKTKYLIKMPDLGLILQKYRAIPLDIMQTYLTMTTPSIERRIRQQKNGADYLYFYTEKHFMPSGEKWDTERPISEKDYVRYLMDGDCSLHPVHKIKYRFIYDSHRYELDIYPFCSNKAILFKFSGADNSSLPPEIEIIRDVTHDPAYKNRQLASVQAL